MRPMTFEKETMKKWIVLLMIMVFVIALLNGCYPDETVKTVVLPSENMEIGNRER